MSDNLRLYSRMFGQISQWHETERVTRRRNLAMMVVGLYLARSVLLTCIASKLPLPATKWSGVTRLRRFLRNQAVDVPRYYEPLLRYLLRAVAGKQLLLIVDTTPLGTTHRALVVAMAYRGRSLPLAWSVYRGETGNVAATATLALLARLQRLIPCDVEVTLLADGGFRSTDLLLWLRRRRWHFVVRLRGQSTFRPAPGEAWLALSDVAIGEGQTIALGPVWIHKTSPFGPTWLVLHWAKGERQPWMLVSDRAETRTTLRLYRKRSRIEAMNRDWKSMGFDLHQTRLRDVQRLERLLLVVALAYVWLVALGSWVVKNSRRSLIDRPDRRDLSYFRLGCDWIDHCLSRGSPLHWRFIPYYL